MLSIIAWNIFLQRISGKESELNNALSCSIALQARVLRRFISDATSGTRPPRSKYFFTRNTKDLLASLMQGTTYVPFVVDRKSVLEEMTVRQLPSNL